MSGIKTSQITALTGILLIFALILHFIGYEDSQKIVLIVSSVIACVPIAIKALKLLWMKAFSIELLVMIAVVGALLIGEFVESATVTFLFLFGAYLEARTLEKTRSSLKELIDMAPLEASVVRNGITVIVPVDEVEEGDRIIIRSGEKVAVDGKIISGQAYMDESAITGESIPTVKRIYDSVFTGTIVDNGFIEVIAERVGDDTTFAKIIELVEEAQEAKTKTQKFLEKFANIYTPGIVILSLLVYIFTKNIELTLTFLVIACPGALVISAPVSIVAGIGNGARNGVLIKGGEVMEKLAKIDMVVFDKTGTLTRGRPEVTDIHTFGMNEDDILTIVAEAEMISEHHLGRTIVNEAKSRVLIMDNEPEEAEVVKGNGIRVRIKGKLIVVGNRKLMLSENILVTDNAEKYAVGREKAGDTAVFAAVDGEMACIISIADQVRTEAQAAIAQLRMDGVKKIIMLTGDNSHTAELVGSKLLLDEVYAELLPEDKVAMVKKLIDEGNHVAMVGDGINDAPAIATADIGLAMGEGGTEISMETADIVLMADKLTQFSHAYALSKTTIRNMKQNTFFAVGTVVLLLLGVLTGKVFLASGMLIHELSVLIVIVNAARILHYNRREINQKLIRDLSLNEEG